MESQYFLTKKPNYKSKNTGNLTKSWSSYSRFKKPYKFTQEFKPAKHLTREEYLENYNNYQKNKKDKSSKNKRETEKKHKNKISDPDFDRYQPTSPNPKRSKSPPKHRKKQSLKNAEPESPSKLEKPLLKYFFQKIPKAVSHLNPSKSEILKFLIKNQKIIELYDLNPETLNQELNDYSLNNFMSFDDFTQFLKFYRNKAYDKSIDNTCLFDHKYLLIMKELFTEVDIYQDSVVSRFLFTEKIRNDRRISKKLEFQALYLPAIDKVLTLSQVLKQIEQEAIIAKGKKDYISWEEFEGYFLQHKITDQALLSKIRILKAKTMVSKTENDDNVMDLDKSLKQLLKEIFDGTQKKKDLKGQFTGFVKTLELLEKIRGFHDFWKFEREIVRKKSGNFLLEIMLKFDFN